MNKSKIKNFILELGFDEEVADIYYALVKNGKMGILKLSRLSGVERTKIYHQKGGLIDEGLLIESKVNNKLYLEACDTHKLKLLVNRESERVHFLKDSLEEVVSMVEESTIQNHPIKVRHYKGSNGIKQVLQNELHSKSKIFTVVSQRVFERHVGKTFYKNWLKSLKKNNGTVISMEVGLSIMMDVYKNTVVIYDFVDGEIFATEIVNKDFAKLQKNFLVSISEFHDILSY